MVIVEDMADHLPKEDPSKGEDQGVSEKHFFLENLKLNPTKPGVQFERIQKGSFYFDKVQGYLQPLPFDCFYIVDFHSAWPRQGRVKIYNLKIVKTEVTGDTPKLCQNKNPFEFFQTNPQANAQWVQFFSFLEKSVFFS